MTGLAGVLWVEIKQLPKEPYNCLTRSGECRRVADNVEFRMLHDRLQVLIR